jgi:tetratricopeptide (TPR) repeat protein
LIRPLAEKKHENPLLIRYAEALFLTGAYDTAENTIKDITATDPENIDALMLFGHIKSAQGKQDTALETYKEISFINPGFAPAMFERAEIYLGQSKLLWAEMFYNRALKADSAFAPAELGLAKISKIRKDDETYKLHLAKARKLEPGIIQEADIKQ